MDFSEYYNRTDLAYSPVFACKADGNKSDVRA